MVGRRPESRSIEAEALDQMRRTVQFQRYLAPSDLDRLVRFLSARIDAGEDLQLDWSRITEQLRAQDEASVLALFDQLSRSTAADAIAQRLREAIPANANFAFLVGAGGSKPAQTEIPTVNEFMPVLWSKAAEIDSQPLLDLQQKCMALGIDDIEVLLTAIDVAESATRYQGVTDLLRFLLFGEAEPESSLARSRSTIPRRPSTEIVQSLRDASQTLFSVLVGMMTNKQPNAIHNEVARVVRSRPTGHVVVTTNYDVCIEEAFGQGNYAYEAGDGTEQKPTVLKLHGSLNWYACMNCDRYVTADLEQIRVATQAGLYPVISMCPQCASTARQLIVPPIGAKVAEHPALLGIRRGAEDAFDRSNVIVSVGYSFRQTDQYIQRMIARAVDRDPQKKIVVFDLDPTPSARLAKYLSTHVRQFSPSESLFRAVGDGTKTLPLFFSALEQMPLVAGPTEGSDNGKAAVV